MADALRFSAVLEVIAVVSIKHNFYIVSCDLQNPEMSHNIINIVIIPITNTQAL